jgi:hypothetical protein
LLPARDEAVERRIVALPQGGERFEIGVGVQRDTGSTGALRGRRQ